MLIVDWTGRVVEWEQDFEKYDKSQREGAMSFRMAVEMHMGVPYETSRAMNALAHAPLIVGKPHDNDGVRILITRGKVPSCDTGSPTTTFGNGSTTGGTVPFVFRQMTCLDPNQYEHALLLLGLKVKISVPKRCSGTFLKGWWVPLATPVQVTDWATAPAAARDFLLRTIDFPGLTRFDLLGALERWVPLPSRILKMTKSMNDPVILYKQPSKYHAARAFLHEMAVQLEPVRGVPFFREFVAAFHVARPGPLKIVADRYRTSVTACWPDLDEQEFWRCFEARYGLDPSTAQQDIAALMLSKPMAVLRRPTWWVLAMRDYN